MNIQIQQIDNDLFVDSRIIAEGFEIEHESLVRTLRKQYSDLKSEKIQTGNRGQPAVFYYLNEEKVLTIPALCRPTEQTIQFQIALVRAFMAMRKQIQHSAPQNYLEALKECTRLEETRLDLEAKIEKDKPKVEFADQVFASEDCLSVGQFSNLIGMGQNNCFKWLRGKGILINHGPKYNHPKQTYIDRGYFEKAEASFAINDSSKIHIKPMITTKGQQWLVQIHNDKANQLILFEQAR